MRGPTSAGPVEASSGGPTSAGPVGASSGGPTSAGPVGASSGGPTSAGPVEASSGGQAVTSPATSSAMSAAAAGRPRLADAVRIESRPARSSRSRTISAISRRTPATRQQAPAAVTSSVLPRSCPGRCEVSTSGAPQHAASAMMPGPALLTTTSAQCSQSDMCWVKPVTVSRPPVSARAAAPAEPTSQQAVAPAGRHHKDIGAAPDHRGGAPGGETAAALPAAGQQHHEPVFRQAQGTSEHRALGWPSGRPRSRGAAGSPAISTWRPARPPAAAR